MKFTLSPLQMMYIAGSRDDVQVDESCVDVSNIIGVPCHVYMEFDSSIIDSNDLANAWRKVLRTHPALTAAYDPDGYGKFLDTPYSDSLVLIDLRRLGRERRADELLKIREKLLCRRTLFEKGQNTGLLLVRIDGLNCRIIFDLNLIACDVASYHQILCELHDAYSSNKTSSLLQEGIVVDEKRAIIDRGFQADDSDEQFWMERIQSIASWSECKDSRSFYCVDGDLLARKSYESLDFIVDIKAANFLRCKASALGINPYSIILSEACRELGKWRSTDRISVCVPFFHGIEEKLIGDFTDLTVVSIKLVEKVEENALSAHEALEDAGKHSIFCTRVVQREMARVGMSSDIVFTMAPGVELIGSPSRPALGHLSFYCSQTPQVGLDIQVSEIGEEFVIHWVVPQGLFDEYDLREHFDNFCNELCADWSEG